MKCDKHNIKGTMLSTLDLQRVSAERAAAVLVLCDKFSLDPSNNFINKFIDLSLAMSAREDASNIMRVISVKNYSENTRCIVQLLHYQNKVIIFQRWTILTDTIPLVLFIEYPWLGLET